MGQPRRARERLLCAAHEAGAGALLAALLARRAREGTLAPGSAAIVTPLAAPAFAAVPVPLHVCEDADPRPLADRLLAEIAPDAVWTGAGIGPTVEKALIESARAAGVPSHAYVDHYWNPWQRFADPRTGARWRWLPDHILVPHALCARRLVEAGCDAERVARFDHPTLEPSPGAVDAAARIRARAALGIGADVLAVLFVSEYGFAPNPNWSWDQPPDADVESLARLLLEHATRTSGDAADPPIVVLVKPHPAEHRDWHAILRDYPGSVARLAGAPPGSDHLACADLAFGLNSMLLLEAGTRGIRAYSHHETCERPQTWLSTLRAEVTEIGSEREVRQLLDARVAAQPRTATRVAGGAA